MKDLPILSRAYGGRCPHCGKRIHLLFALEKGGEPSEELGIPPQDMNKVEVQSSASKVKKDV